jgi:hypothetical protein
MREMARQMIWGTRGIAAALFGPEHAHEHRRTLYSLIERGSIPFRMGRTPCAWSDQIEDFLEGKAREAAGNMGHRNDRRRYRESAARRTTGRRFHRKRKRMHVVYLCQRWIRQVIFRRARGYGLGGITPPTPPTPPQT